MRTLALPRATAVAAVLALALAACGGAEPTGETGGTETATETEASPTDGATPDELAVINPGQLTVCSDIPYPPFEFEEDGEFTGFDLELMGAIADQIGLELNVTAIGFDPIQSGTALNADQCDVAASAMTITEEREQNVDFSEPYYNAEQSLLTTTETGISALEDTAGSTIGVQSATTGEMYADENAPEDTTIQRFENPGDLFTALQAGQIEAILQDLPVNAENARTNEGVEVVETYDTGEQYGFAVAEEGSDALLEAINQGLQTIRDEGTYDQLYEEYFSTE